MGSTYSGFWVDFTFLTHPPLFKKLKCLLQCGMQTPWAGNQDCSESGLSIPFYSHLVLPPTNPPFGSDWYSWWLRTISTFLPAHLCYNHSCDLKALPSFCPFLTHTSSKPTSSSPSPSLEHLSCLPYHSFCILRSAALCSLSYTNLSSTRHRERQGRGRRQI